MASRRDQVLSYQFMAQRMISAFVYRDPELTSPFSRASSTLFVSVMAAVIMLGAAAVYGLVVKGGNKSWRNPQAVVVEKETGARYVYSGGQLHPVLNYTSARLILKQSQPPTVLVSSASLRAAPRGATLGIVGVPDSLPAPGQLLDSPWTLCSQPDLDPAGRPVRRSALFISRQPEGGRDLGESAMLVGHPDGSVFLVWHDTRFLIRDPRIVLDALALGQAPIVAAAAAWINAVPQGPDIGSVPIGGRGAAGPVTGTRVGQVLVSQSESGATQYFAVLRDGIADITQVQTDILLHDPKTVAAYPGSVPRAMPRTDLAAAKRSPTRLLPRASGPQPPANTPRIASPADASAGLCLVSAGGAAGPRVNVDVGLPPPTPVTAAVSGAGGTGGTGPLVADRVVVAPGAGVLVQADAAPQASGSPLSIVTDLGIRYPLATRDVAAYLGYSAGSAVHMPAGLVSLIPTGRALDPSLAGQPAVVG